MRTYSKKLGKYLLIPAVDECTLCKDAKASITKTSPKLAQYSANSKLVKFVLSTNAESTKNDDFPDLTIAEEFGKTILTANISKIDINENLFFIIYAEGNIDTKLDYFVFAYFLGKDKESFFDYLDKNSIKLQVKDLGSNKYTVCFNRTYTTNTTYYIKASYEMNDEEKIDTIAISEAKGYYEIINPSYTNNEQLNYTLEATQEVFYIKVMARVSLEDEKIIYLYEPYKINKGSKEPKPDDDDGDDDKTRLIVIIVVGLILLVVVIVLVVIIVMYNSKNKDLLNQVNKISFVQSGASGKDDANLLLDNQNELD